MITYKHSQWYNIDHAGYYPQVAWLTYEIGQTYRGHKKWLDEKFFPGLMDSYTRGYAFAIDPCSQEWARVNKSLPTFDGTLVGCSLLKNEPEEKKICCLYVNNQYRKQGIASQLIKDSFELLDTDKPLMTVAENNLEQLTPLIKKFGFELTSVKESVYKQGVKEYYYNEGLAR